MIFRIELEGGRSFYFDAENFEVATAIAVQYKIKYRSCFYELRRVHIRPSDYKDWTHRPIGGVKL